MTLPLDGEMELRLLAVLPQARRSGIGWRLLAESANLAQANGASGLVLDTGADNERSQQLYRRFGFEQIHVRPRYYRDGVNALIMRLELRTAGAGTADAAGKMTGQDSDQPREADRP